MTDTPYTALTQEQVRKIVGDKNELLSWEDCETYMNLPSGTRPRTYGYLERGECADQIIAIRSQEHMDKYGKDLGFVWLSHTDINDIIKSR